MCIYVKGELLSKATGGCFEVSNEIVKKLRLGTVMSLDDILALFHGGVKGLRFESGDVIFDGFPETDEPEVVVAWTSLFTAINRTAITQRHVRPLRKTVENEKFVFHSWIVRIGLNGKQYKNVRRILYKNLSGHTAFRTPEDEALWKERKTLVRHTI